MLSDERKKLLYRLKKTGKGETICLQHWETRLLTIWIEQLTEQRDVSNNKNVLLMAKLKALNRKDGD